MTDTKRPVRIANCSGFFGDRLAVALDLVALQERVGKRVPRFTVHRMLSLPR